MNRKYIPNYITVLRCFLIIPILYFLLNRDYRLAFYLFVLAGISDGLDGFLARRFGWMTPLGAMLDPLADKLLMVLTYLALGYLGNLPLWLVVIVIGRDLLIIAGALVYRLWIAEVDYAATFISKLNTVLQLGLVIAVLFNEVYGIIPQQILEISTYVVASTTITSFLDYVWAWTKRAYRVKHPIIEETQND